MFEWKTMETTELFSNFQFRCIVSNVKCSSSLTFRNITSDPKGILCQLISDANILHHSSLRREERSWAERRSLSDANGLPASVRSSTPVDVLPREQR